MTVRSWIQVCCDYPTWGLAHLSYSSCVCWVSVGATRAQCFLSVQVAINTHAYLHTTSCTCRHCGSWLASFSGHSHILSRCRGRLRDKMWEWPGVEARSWFCGSWSRGHESKWILYVCMCRICLDPCPLDQLPQNQLPQGQFTPDQLPTRSIVGRLTPTRSTLNKSC